MTILRRRRGWKPKYGECPLTPREAFTLKFCYGGEITIRGGQLKYVGGTFRYFDWVSIKEMNVSTLYKFAADIGLQHPESFEYYYKDSARFFGQLTEIMNTRDVIKMCTNLDEDRVAIVYIYLPDRTLTFAESSDDVRPANNQSIVSVISISDYEMDDSAGETYDNSSDRSPTGRAEDTNRMLILSEKKVSKSFTKEKTVAATMNTLNTHKKRNMRFGDKSILKKGDEVSGDNGCTSEMKLNTGITKSGRRGNVRSCRFCEK